MVLGPLTAGSSLLGGIGSILGGRAAANGADNAADYTKNIMSWLKDVSNDNFRGSREEIGKTRQKVLGESRDLRNRSHRTARDARDANTGILTDSRDRSIADVRGDRRDGMRDIRGNRRLNLGDINRTAQGNLGDINETEAENLGSIGATKRQNLRTARGQLGASLGYFEPAIGTGQNALSAFSDVLGLTNGGFDLALTPATQFLMEQGRNTVEGGAAGSGGLYSGETLAELEKMRTGLASQDRQNQMAELLSLIGLGQSAGNSAASLRSGFTDDAAAYRTNAQNAGIDVRDAAMAGRVNVRGAASDRRTDVRDDATQAMLGLRDDTTGDMNALRQFYNPALVGVNDTYASRANTADTNFANMNTSAWNNQLQDTLGARQFMQNMKLSAGTNLAPTAAGMIAGKGAAQAGGIIGATNALMGGFGNMAYNQGMQQGGAMPAGMPGAMPGAMPVGAPQSAIPWMQQTYLPQPPAGGSWTGALY